MRPKKFWPPLPLLFIAPPCFPRTRHKSSPSSSHSFQAYHVGRLLRKKSGCSEGAAPERIKQRTHHTLRHQTKLGEEPEGASSVVIGRQIIRDGLISWPWGVSSFGPVFVEFTQSSEPRQLRETAKQHIIKSLLQDHPLVFAHCHQASPHTAVLHPSHAVFVRGLN